MNKVRMLISEDSTGFRDDEITLAWDDKTLCFFFSDGSKITLEHGDQVEVNLDWEKANGIKN